MFGYIYPFKMDLKLKHYNTFKSYYCSLCHTIKKNYGNIPRISLNFDITFMAIFLDSFSIKKPVIEKKVCLIHPIEKKYIMKNISSIEYSSHINIILTHNKIVDDINDENNLLSKILLPISNKYMQNLPNYLNNIKHKINNHLKNLKELENKNKILSIDEYAHPFSNLMKEIFNFYCKFNDFDNKTLVHINRLSYSLGKWIYIIDSLNDIEKDLKTSSFNPIIHIHNITKEKINIETFKKSIQDKYYSLLTHVNYNCLENFKYLKLNKNYDLIENILQLGMPFKTDKIINNFNCNNKKEVSMNV